jgi:hypothetical protein
MAFSSCRGGGGGIFHYFLYSGDYIHTGTGAQTSAASKRHFRPRLQNAAGGLGGEELDGWGGGGGVTIPITFERTFMGICY